LRAIIGRRERFPAQREEGESRRQHQPLLRCADRDVHAPFVVPVVHAPDRRHRIDHQHRIVAGVIHRAAHRGDIRHRAGGRLVVDDAHRAVRPFAIAPQQARDLTRIGAVTPVALDDIDVETEAARDLDPVERELSGFGHEHAVARAHRIGERCFPAAGAGRGIDHDAAARAAHPPQAIEDGARECGVVRPAMIDGRLTDGAQDARGHVRWARKLEEMPAGSMSRHVALDMQKKTVGAESGSRRERVSSACARPVRS
jgi:hypothetical protein